MTTEPVLQKVMRLIAAASAESRVSEISRLTKLAERLTEIQNTQRELELEVQRLAGELDQTVTGANGRSLSTESLTAANRPTEVVHEQLAQLLGPLAIDINWAAAGKPRSKQTICERKASDTLRVFFESILQQFGDATMEKLAVLRVNRAPPLSRRPGVEFLNRKRGILYQHQRVGTTEWHVLTHSSTAEKIEIIRQVAQALRFPPGAVKAREIDVKQEIMKLLSTP